MPAPGDQYRDNQNTVNPFADNKPRISEFTAAEIATLQSRLDKQLGPEYISTRPGNGGGKVHYLAAEKVINLANEVFGFNGWSSSIQNVQIDFVDENRETGRINLGLSTIVRVTLKDGTYHEDTGYGHCENIKGKAAAFEKAKKEAATDAMKRALRNFGNVLGNCLYDKEYLQKVAKVKVAPSKWDQDNLHRHPDYAPIKKEPQQTQDQAAQSRDSIVQRNTSMQSLASVGSGEFDEDFGGTELDETDFSHPDEVRLDDTMTSNNRPSPVRRTMNGQAQEPSRPGVTRTHTTPPTRPSNVQAPAPVQGIQAPQKPQAVQRPPMNAVLPSSRMLPPQTPGQQQRAQPSYGGNGQPPQNGDGVRSNPSSGTAADPPRQPHITNNTIGQPQPPMNEQPVQPPPGAPMGFVSGRAADAHQPAAFNPHAESPSIRRTQGVHNNVSAPIKRAALPNGQPAPQSIPPATGYQSPGGNIPHGVPGRFSGPNYANPAADMHRKIGMPGGAPAMQNRGAYKPPSVTKRHAMTDVTNTHGMDGASDPAPKKARTEGESESQQLGGENNAAAAR